MTLSTASAVSVTLHDGDARTFADSPDVISYANTEYVSSPSEFQVTTKGEIWRYYQWIALLEEGNWVEAETTIETTSAGIQFWGDANDGWARVLVDGSEVWTGNTYGSSQEPYIKYLEISVWIKVLTLSEWRTWVFPVEWVEMV